MYSSRRRFNKARVTRYWAKITADPDKRRRRPPALEILGTHALRSGQIRKLIGAHSRAVEVIDYAVRVAKLESAFQ
jgi:hypothetical protein